MDYKVVLSDHFVSDLEQIVESLMQRADPETAFRIGNELLDRAVEVGQSPLAGKPVKGRPGARKVLRYRYLIYYDVNEISQTVEFLRIWHGARHPNSLRLE
jgi:plasmid stabilization system protein ParE